MKFFIDLNTYIFNIDNPIPKYNYISKFNKKKNIFKILRYIILFQIWYFIIKPI
jgi:hypothetical protein